MSRSMGLASAMALAMAWVLMPGTRSALAGDKSLIATLLNGAEMRYRYTVRVEETTSLTASPAPGVQSANTQTVGILVRVRADTRALNIVDVVYESFKITVEQGQGSLEIDLGGPAPDEKAPAQARELYAALHEIVGTTITINTAPGSGEITLFHGGEQLLKSPAGPALRRYLDQDLFKASFGIIFQLKPNSAMPPPGQQWFQQGYIFTSAHMAKTPVWETRTVEGVLADVATVKGLTRANGNPKDADKGPVFLKGVNAECEYTWDVFRGRLISAKRNEIINSRYERDRVKYDSDLVSRSTLELAPEVVKPLVSPAPASERGTPPKPPGTPGDPRPAKPEGKHGP